MTDTLGSDPKIENQNFALLSFLSPEKVQNSEYSKLHSQILLEKDTKKKCDMYEKLLSLKENTRGLKIRGVFSKLEDAKDYAQKLREGDHFFDIYVGSIGEWVPWDDSTRSDDNVYAEKQLNDLMHEYKKQYKNAADEHRKRVSHHNNDH